MYRSNTENARVPDEERYISLVNLSQYNRNRETITLERPESEATSPDEDECDFPIAQLNVVNMHSDMSRSPSPQPRVLRSLIKERRRVLRKIAANAAGVASVTRALIPANAEHFARYTTLENALNECPDIYRRPEKDVNPNGKPIRKFLLPEIFEEEKKNNPPPNEKVAEFAQQIFYSTIFKQ